MCWCMSCSCRSRKSGKPLERPPDMRYPQMPENEYEDPTPKYKPPLPTVVTVQPPPLPRQLPTVPGDSGSDYLSTDGTQRNASAFNQQGCITLPNERGLIPLTDEEEKRVFSEGKEGIRETRLAVIPDDDFARIYPSNSEQ